MVKTWTEANSITADLMVQQGWAWNQDTAVWIGKHGQVARVSFIPDYSNLTGKTAEDFSYTGADLKIITPGQSGVGVQSLVRF